MINVLRILFRSIADICYPIIERLLGGKGYLNDQYNFHIYFHVFATGGKLNEINSHF